VKSLLDVAAVAYEIDTTLVRGLDYYTRTLFEFTSDALGAQSGVAGGGRYDGLVELLGGPPTPGIGWAAGIERILLASGATSPAPPALDLYIAHENARAEAFQTALEARKAGLRAQLDLGGRTLKGQLKQAERLGARFVATIEPGSARLRDRDGGTEREIAREDIAQQVHAS
jgi:histidyl-tRNA synthetase